MENTKQFSSNISQIVGIAEKAGSAIMEIYSQDDFNTAYKDDNSPLTLADIASHKVIKENLEMLEPKLPVLSEESKQATYEVRRSWESYWLIDPLDGTKEFIKKNGEFTVNIALIINAMPVLGVVHAPSLGVTYYACKGKGAFKKTGDNRIEKIRTNDNMKGVLKIVASRSHKGEKLEGFIKDISSKMSEVEYINMGSSLKLCLVAEGTAHLYPRLGPTMEWDTAAAQCIVEEAGGLVTDIRGNTIIYNKKDLLNKDFIVSSSVELLNSIIERQGKNNKGNNIKFQETSILKMITIVSGLPRSGTSMMMKMLEAGGIGVVVDNIRKADEDNPCGYYEFENVKRIKKDSEWLNDVHGKAVKMVSMLLYDLPSDRNYRVIFMKRNMEEIVSSQKTMLERKGEDNTAGNKELRILFEKHLNEIEKWLAEQKNIKVLYVSYNNIIKDPHKQVQVINAFFDNKLDSGKMLNAIDKSLYRKRWTQGNSQETTEAILSDQPEDIHEKEKIEAQLRSLGYM